MWLRVHWDATNEGKIAEHGLTKEEVEDVVLDPLTDWTISKSSRRLLGRGWTSTGRFIAVPVDELDRDTVRPATAYEVEEPS